MGLQVQLFLDDKRMAILDKHKVNLLSSSAVREFFYDYIDSLEEKQGKKEGMVVGNATSNNSE